MRDGPPSYISAVRIAPHAGHERSPREFSVRRGYVAAMWERERYISLVTYRRNGTAVETPVWFAELGGRYYVFTQGDAYKVKLLRRNRDIRAAPCRMLGTVTGDWVSGTGRIIEDCRQPCPVIG